MQQPRRRRIGEGRRRAPGDVVTGEHDTAGEFIGRIVRATAGGGCTVRLDDGRELGFAALAAMELRTLEERDAPMRREFDGSYVLDESARAA